MIKAGTHVEVTLKSTTTPMEERKPTWNKVVGRLVVDADENGSILIERDKPDPHPFWQTSMIKTLRPVNDCEHEACTLNSVYIVKEIK